MSALPKATYTASSVTAGVVAARGDFSGGRWATPEPKACRHSSLPVSPAKQRVSRAFFPSFTWGGTDPRSPQTTGELVPQPGTLTAQRTFSVWFQRIGSFLPSATPSAFGPLQQGQLVLGFSFDFTVCQKTTSPLRSRFNFPSASLMFEPVAKKS